MDARQQLLQSLMQDLQNYQMPERYSPEKKEQIMKGRRGQADIDAGRAAIRENEEQYQRAVDQRAALQTQIQQVQGEIETATTKAQQDDPANQAIQFGKSVGVPLAGYGAGHVIGSKFGAGFDTTAAGRAENVSRLAEKLRSLDRADPASKAQAAAVVDTYDKQKLGRTGRSRAQWAGPAALLGLSQATRAGADYADDPYLKEGLNLFASAEQAGAGGMLFQQVIDTLRAKSPLNSADVTEIEAARRLINPKGKYDAVQGALEEPAPAPKAASATKAPPAPGTRPALLAQAKSMGLPATTKTKKADLEKMVAKALRSSGSRTAKGVKRVTKAATKAPIVPLAVGATIYDALRSPGEASTGEDGEPMGRGQAALTAAGGAGATAYGMERLKSLLADFPMIGKVAGAAMAPVAAYQTGEMIADEFETPSELENPMVAGLAEEVMPAYYQWAAQQEAGDAPDISFDPLIQAGAEDPQTASLLAELIRARLAEFSLPQ